MSVLCVHVMSSALLHSHILITTSSIGTDALCCRHHLHRITLHTAAVSHRNPIVWRRCPHYRHRGSYSSRRRRRRRKYHVCVDYNGSHSGEGSPAPCYAIYSHLISCNPLCSSPKWSNCLQEMRNEEYLIEPSTRIDVAAYSGQSDQLQTRCLKTYYTL